MSVAVLDTCPVCGGADGEHVVVGGLTCPEEGEDMELPTVSEIAVELGAGAERRGKA